MPTINQLIKRSRKNQTKKSKSPALQFIKNSIKRTTVPLACPQKR
jgi:small subunit ribosomal protein S12